MIMVEDIEMQKLEGRICRKAKKMVKDNRQKMMVYQDEESQKGMAVEKDIRQKMAENGRKSQKIVDDGISR